MRQIYFVSSTRSHSYSSDLSMASYVLRTSRCNNDVDSCLKNVGRDVQLVAKDVQLVQEKSPNEVRKKQEIGKKEKIVTQVLSA